MEIKEIKDKKKYNNIILNDTNNQFLQSWEWGEFQKSAGLNILRLGLEGDKGLILVFTLIIKKLGFGKNYWYSPRITFNNSLNLKNEQKIEIDFLIKELIKKAKEERIIFFRMDLLSELLNIKNQSSVVKTIDVQPSKSIILDISKDEEEILKEMHQKTRYNIRLSEKKSVKIRKSIASKDFNQWWEIMNETKTRDAFRLHQKGYYQKMLDIDFIELFLAEHEGEIIAGNIISFFGDTATYIHGASSNKKRNVMAPYALQWHSINESKKRNCKFYDFYGIDDEKWPGVTRFKRGFGGNEIRYPGTFDLIFDKKLYKIYKVIRRIRRMI